VNDFRQTIAALDDATPAPSRVDLARLCLRAADDCEHSYRRWRAGAMAACAATLLVGIGAASLVDVDFQRDRMTVAWRRHAAPPAPHVLVDNDPVIASPQDVETAVLADRATTPVDSDIRLSYPALRDRALAQGIESLPLPELSSADGFDNSTVDPGGNYLELRQQLLDAAQNTPARSDNRDV